MKIGIISDIHEDIVALKDAFKVLHAANCDEVVCLGDLTGFKVNTYPYLDSRSAHECIAMIRSNCNKVVVGNNDLFQIKKLPSCQGGFDFPDSWYEMDFFERKAASRESVFLYEDIVLPALLTKEDRSYLESLPEFIVAQFDSLKVMLSHFCYPDLLGLRTYFPKSAEEFFAHLDFEQRHGCSLGISGHMHYEGVSICNYEMIKRNDFGSFNLSSGVQWVYGPCVARGRFKNGVMVLDTTTSLITAVPLKKALLLGEAERISIQIQNT